MTTPFSEIRRNPAAEQRLLGPYQRFAVADWSDQPEELVGLYSAIAYVQGTLPYVLADERRATVERLRQRMDDRDLTVGCRQVLRRILDAEAER